jgi:hypothetical protein
MQNGVMDRLSGSTLGVSPLLALTRSVEDQLKQGRGMTPAFLPLPEKRELLLTLVDLRNQVEGLLVDALSVSADVADAEGFRSVGSWLSTHAHEERSATSLQRLADDAVARYPLLLEGLRNGEVSIRQAESITHALDALGPDVSRDICTEAEARMVALAGEFDATELRRLGRAILETIDPATFEDHERERLEAELRKAHEATRLSLKARGDGTTRVSGVLPDAIAARLRTCLAAFSSPRHDAASSRPDATTETPDPVGDSRYLDPVTGRRLPGDRVRGEAFCAFIEAADPQRMPLQGGAATSIIITMDLDKLTAGVGAATTGAERLPASDVRRLACQANLIPAVLGGRSEVLDLGRARRLFSPGQRKALTLRYRTCAVEGCPVPAEQCEAHHLRPWSRGGPTDLADGVLACPRHHHLFHDERYEMSRAPSGDVRLRRRC